MAKTCQWEGEMEKEMGITQNRGTMETNPCQQQTKEKQKEDLQHNLTAESIQLLILFELNEQ